MIYRQCGGVIRLIVTFCGHSEVPDREPVRGWLTDVCERLIEGGAARTLAYARKRKKTILAYGECPVP